MIFDGHNDMLLRLWRADPARRLALWRDSGGVGHLDLARMRRGGFAGGFFAVYVPSPGGIGLDAAMRAPSYHLPLPPAIPAREALPVAVEMAGILHQIERDDPTALAICRTAADVARCLGTGTIAAILHLEGAEAIGPDLAALDLLHAAGLRSLGPVWSRPTIWGHGVPFAYPSTPDTGPGLTDLGHTLVRACNERRILIDLSHITQAGFWDVARLSDAPLVATHSNAHAVCPSSRNLTDRQLHAIRDTGGMVGLNFAVSFLRADGSQNADTPLETLLRHLDHLIAQAGPTQVGLGSDFDGATIPAIIGDAAGLPTLQAALTPHYGPTLTAHLTHTNWLRLLTATWREPG